MENFDIRTKALLGNDFDKIKDKTIAVIGLGGVGSIIPLTLVMTGVKKIIIIDKDKVDESNLNRQIGYNLNDVGKYKASALKEKLELLRKDVQVIDIPKNIDDKFDFELLKQCDFIADCIDDIQAKILLAKFATTNNIDFISSLGMGNRIDPSKVFITTLNKTTSCPLAKKYRYLLKKENVDISSIHVAFSEELPIIKDKVVSSIAFVPNAAGLNIASYIIKTLIGW